MGRGSAMPRQTTIVNPQHPEISSTANFLCNAVVYLSQTFPSLISLKSDRLPLCNFILCFLNQYHRVCRQSDRDTDAEAVTVQPLKKKCPRLYGGAIRRWHQGGMRQMPKPAYPHYRIQPPIGGMMPNCVNQENRSTSTQCSATFPSLNLKN
jgi:hypothetical protein